MKNDLYRIKHTAIISMVIVKFEYVAENAEYLLVLYGIYLICFKYGVEVDEYRNQSKTEIISMQLPHISLWFSYHKLYNK